MLLLAREQKTSRDLKGQRARYPKSLLRGRSHLLRLLGESSTHRGARTHDHKVKSLALYRLSWAGS